MSAIDEERIKQILGGHDSRLREIHERILRIHDELLDTDSLIEAVSLKKIEWDKEGGSRGGIKKDLTDVMLQHQRLARERELELRGEMYRLAEEEEEINRVWVCFHALRGKEYTFLDLLYVQSQPYKAAELESGFSHKTFETYRRSGLKKILQMYESEFSNMELVRGGMIENPKRKNKTTKKTVEYEQIKLKII